MENLLEHRWLGNPVERWAAAIAILLATVVALTWLRSAVVRRATREPKRRRDEVALAIASHTKLPTFVLAGLVLGSNVLHVSNTLATWLRGFTVVAVAVQVALWLTLAGAQLFPVRRDPDGTMPPGSTLNGAIGFVVRIVIWSVAALWVLSNFGIDVSTLVAGLGIGGLAAALAVQNLLGDLFASISLYSDRSFDLGDSVAVGDVVGTVSRIGWRSTQLRTLSGEQIVIANSDLARSRIRNFTRMEQRRVVLTFGVPYDTPSSVLAKLPSVLESIVGGTAGTRFDRAHVARLADSAIELELVYFVASQEMRAHMDAQQAILLAVLDRFAAESVSLAFPTQIVHVGSLPSASPRASG